MMFDDMCTPFCELLPGTGNHAEHDAGGRFVQDSPKAKL